MHAYDVRRVVRIASMLTLSLGGVQSCAYDQAAGPGDVAESPVSLTPAGLWIASTSAPAALRLSAEQLVAGGHVVPASELVPAGVQLHSLVGLAFDATGRMWIASQDDSVLIALSPTARDTAGSRTNAVVISSNARSLSAPVGLAFDARHRLWVANFGNGTLARFDSAQLASSGAPSPSVIIGGLARPTALAFDAEGALWVSDMRAGTIVAYGADQLETSGSPAPRVRLTGADRSLSVPSAIAFDASGTLWVTNLRDGTISGVDATQRATSGAVTPRVTLALRQPLDVVSSPAGLAFDDDGSAWVAGLEGGVRKYSRAQLARSGSPAPSVSVTLDDHALLWGVAFWPAPKGLPIH